MTRYIDADKLQEAFKELHGGKRSLLIDTEPTADVRENVRGKWIYDAEAYPLGNPYGHYDCDQCGESVPDKTNYCPNCGADMRGGEANGN